MLFTSRYTPLAASAVVCRLSSGRSLESVCRDPDLPCSSTVRLWMKRDPDFAAQVEAVRVYGRSGKGRRPWHIGRRPSVYTEALGAGICAALAEGFNLLEICASPDVPVKRNEVLRWARIHPEFGKAYAEARRPRPTGEGLSIGRGRPYPYTPERGQAVIDRLLEGRALTDICRDPDMPARAVIQRWRSRHLDFHLAMDEARRFQLDLLLDEMREAADQGRKATQARFIANGLVARGTRPMGAGRADEPEAVDEALWRPKPKPPRARRPKAPGIGHNSRGR